MKNFLSQQKSAIPKPGLVLANDFLKARYLTPEQIAKHLKIPKATISQIIDGHLPITTEIAIKFAGAFGTSPEFWLDLQARYDLIQAMEKTTSPKRIFSPFDEVTTKTGEQS
jgi:addiction module HigA family antidote